MQIQSSLGPVDKCEAKEVGYLSVLHSEVVVAFVNLLVDQGVQNHIVGAATKFV